MRLIDADKIEKFIEDGLNCKDERKRFGHDAIEIMTEIHYAPTISPPPNDPLTLDEMREMDGEPVWVDFQKCQEASGWMLVSTSRHCIYDGMLGDCDFENCGKTWFAYRRKPEEGTNAAT